MIVTPTLTNFTGGEISPRMAGRTDVSRYYNACMTLENFVVHPQGGATRRSGFRYIADAGNHARPSAFIPFQFNAEQTYVLELYENEAGQGKLRVFMDRGVVMTDEAPYSIDSPYKQKDLPALRWVQSNDTLILVHQDYQVRTLTRTDHDAWAFGVVDFMPRVAAPTITAHATGGSWPYEGVAHAYVATAQSDKFESLMSDEHVVANGPRSIDDSNDNEYVIVKGLATAGATVYVFKKRNGVYGFMGKAKADNNGVWSFRDDGLDTPDVSEIPLEARNPFDGAGKYPGFAAFFEQRLLLAGTKDNPNRLYFSRTAGIFDFRIRPDDIEPVDDDAFDYDLNDHDGNSITSLCSRGVVYVGTSHGVFSVGGSGGDPIAPGKVQCDLFSTRAAANVPTLRASNSALYVSRSGLKVSELAYSFQNDSHNSSDMTVLAEHITSPGISRLAWAGEPDSLVFALRDDGVVLSFTYMRDQDVTAWSRLPTSGVVESIAVIHNDDQHRDELWVLVKREVNGTTRRFIEVLEKEYDGLTETIKDAFFVDSGLSYKGNPTPTLTGLHHLAGETVQVLADGIVSTGTVSSAGEITLAKAASTVHAGLPFTSTLVPMPFEMAMNTGSSRAARKRISKIHALFHNTIGGEIGTDEECMEPVRYLTTSDPLGVALEPFSGTKTVNLTKGWTLESNIAVRQEQPYPMTVLSLTPEVSVNA